MEVIHLDAKTLENKMAEKLVALKKTNKKTSCLVSVVVQRVFFVMFYVILYNICLTEAGTHLLTFPKIYIDQVFSPRKKTL